ncbi:hypothetical protein FBU31_001896, partial [Coemansia sp. 'formosensis']
KLKEYMPQAIVDDMGRGDLHFLMSMDSTSLNRQILRYTRMQRLNETRSWRFKKIREKVKKAYSDDAINKAEQRLRGYDPCTMDPAKFKAYVEARAREWDLLSKIYADMKTSHEDSKHPDCKHSCHEICTVALRHKLNLSTYLNKQQSKERLMLNIKKKSGNRRVLVMGNWSASMTKFHEPIRGKSWRDLFKNHGFRLFLIDEYQTSLICPTCDLDLEKFKRVKNPQLYMAKKYPTVLCNGLLRCTNQKCLQREEKYKDTSKLWLYNRNVAAVVNFQRIIKSLLEIGDIPEQFKHSIFRESAAKKSYSANKGKSSEPIDTMFSSWHFAYKKSLLHSKRISYNRTRKHFAKVLPSGIT